MARYTGPVCRLCRREGQKLFLKGQKCYTDKCAIERRASPPGQHGPTHARRRKQSDYAVQLREKQKVKRIYGLLERPFRTLFEKSSARDGITGENMLISLESRLDNVIFRMGFAASRKAARQVVRHRHVAVNSRIVDIPSYQVGPGDEIAIRPKSKDLLSVQVSRESRTRIALVEWRLLDEKNLIGRMIRRPTRQDIPLAVQEQLIVELYSK